MKKSIKTLLLLVLCVSLLSGCGENKTPIIAVENLEDLSTPTNTPDSDSEINGPQEATSDTPNTDSTNNSSLEATSDTPNTDFSNNSSQEATSNTPNTDSANNSSPEAISDTPLPKELTYENENRTPASPQPSNTIAKEPSNNYLIILDNSSLVDSIKEFAEFKTSEGYNVTSVVVDEICSGKAPAVEEIRNYLFTKDKEDDIEFVLLIGDPFSKKKANKDDTGGKIPMKYFYFFNNNHTSLYLSDIVIFKDGKGINNGSVPTDLYYYVDLDWDKDKDGYYGETTDDISISNADQFKCLYKLGRIPFNDSTTVSEILKNSINKELEFTNMKQPMNVLIAAGMSSFSPLFIDGAFWGELLKTNMIDSNVITMYEQQGYKHSTYESTLPLTRENFATEWNKGYDVIFTEGHGGCQRYVWDVDRNENGLLDDNWPDIFFEEFFVKKDIEKKSTTFLVMSGCATGRLEKDRYETNYVQVPQLLAKNIIAAGVGTTKGILVGQDQKESSIFSVWKNSDDTFGGVFQDAIVNLYKIFSFNSFDFFHTLYSYCYFGDPSFSLR